jgi:hypothetical protein
VKQRLAFFELKNLISVLIAVYISSKKIAPALLVELLGFSINSESSNTLSTASTILNR